MGFIAHQLGDNERAVDFLSQAVSVNPTNPEALNTLGTSYTKLGLLDRAIGCFERALETNPGHANSLNSLGVALQRQGSVAEAQAAFEGAVRANPMDPGAHLNLCAMVYDDRDLGPAIAALEMGLTANPLHGPSNFHLAAVADRLGDPAAAELILRRVESLPESYLDSWQYVRTHAGEARSFGTTWDTMGHSLEECTVDGLILEFGVRYGASTHFIAARTDRPIHAFDSFEGLPEDWGPEKRGAYTTHGVLPDVPDHVSLHAGWFEDTLPAFRRESRGPIRFLHVDCDVYSSTRTIFQELADGIVPGTVILFDEYLLNEHWREDEYKAFQEAVSEHGWTYEYLGYSLFSKQASVRITGVAPAISVSLELL